MCGLLFQIDGTTKVKFLVLSDAYLVTLSFIITNQNLYFSALNPSSGKAVQELGQLCFGPAK